MARPRKENAEYFSHDSGMRNDEKVLALRSKFGNQGYAFWCMFLEILTHEEGFKKEIKTEVQKELLAGDLRVSVEEMQDILSFCSRIELLQEKDNIFWSDNLIKRLEPMVQKREFLRQKYEDKRVSAPEMPVSTAEMPQSKVKESKVNNIIDIELATLLRDKIKENLPTFKEPNIDSWAKEIEKMRRIDKRTEEQIRYLIEWCQQDSFWQGNILSTKKLREKFDTLVAQVKRAKTNSKGITII